MPALNLVAWILLGVVPPMMAEDTSRGAAVGLFPRYIAATPARQDGACAERCAQGHAQGWPGREGKYRGRDARATPASPALTRTHNACTCQARGRSSQHKRAL